jgi:hypothetical protein
MKALKKKLALNFNVVVMDDFCADLNISLHKICMNYSLDLFAQICTKKFNIEYKSKTFYVRIIFVLYRKDTIKWRGKLL